MSGPRAPANRDYDNYRNAYPPVKGIPVIDRDESLYDVASNAFYEGWNGRLDKAPEIVRVLDIGKPEDGGRVDRKAFYRFRNFLEGARQQSRYWSYKGNEKRLFHGTRRLCTLGNPTRRNETHQNCCTHPDCSVCNIIQDNFDMSHALERRKRFGEGIYFTENSNRATQDDFQGRVYGSARGRHASTIEDNGQYRAVLLCRVLTGRPWYANGAGMGELQEAPAGFDSIVAQYNGGHGRNQKGDNETVVYQPYAVLPWLLIIVDPRRIETEHPAVRQDTSSSSDNDSYDQNIDSDDSDRY